MQAPVSLVALNLYANSSSFVHPVILDANVTCQYLRQMFSMATNSSSAATTINAVFSGSVIHTYDLAVFVRQTGTNSNSLSRIFYTTIGSTIQHSLSANSTGSQWTLSHFISYPVTGGTSSYSTSTAVSQTRFDFSSNLLTLFTNTRFVDYPFVTSLSAGNYWFAAGRSSSSGTQSAGAMTNLVITGLPIGQSWGAFTIGQMGVDTTRSINVHPFHGSYSIVAGATTATVAQSQISFVVNHNESHLQFMFNS